MLPRWHILFGALFTLLLWAFSPRIPLAYLALTFAASVLIDFDHYVCAAYRERTLSFKKALKYHRLQARAMEQKERRGLKPRSDFHLFHTLEFHVLIGVLGIFIVPFFYLFIGMVFHSLLDLYDGLRKNIVHRREYFFFNWLRERF
ncbi:MAG TPA: hypothetical protein VJK03_04555 [Candidatus Nanoarchaeia archaeon]|nr:hypothetical protein [Candidatus Nanoarchaeia archaeon]